MRGGGPGARGAGDVGRGALCRHDDEDLGNVPLHVVDVCGGGAGRSVRSRSPQVRRSGGGGGGGGRRRLGPKGGEREDGRAHWRAPGGGTRGSSPSRCPRGRGRPCRRTPAGARGAAPAGARRSVQRRKKSLRVRGGLGAGRRGGERRRRAGCGERPGGSRLCGHAEAEPLCAVDEPRRQAEVEPVGWAVVVPTELAEALLEPERGPPRLRVEMDALIM